MNSAEKLDGFHGQLLLIYLRSKCALSEHECCLHMRSWRMSSNTEYKYSLKRTVQSCKLAASSGCTDLFMTNSHDIQGRPLQDQPREASGAPTGAHAADASRFNCPPGGKQKACSRNTLETSSRNSLR